MSMKKHWTWYVVGGLVVGVAAAIGWGLFNPNVTQAPTVNNGTTSNVTPGGNANTVPANTNTAPVSINEFSTADLPDRDGHFDFTAELPAGWVAEYVSASQAINFYDPRAEGDSSLNQSMVFVKFFTGSDFATLSTVDIKSQTSLTIKDRPAVTYVIAKKPGVPNFADQPDWRNSEHRVTDIRSSSSSPTTFYVFAKSPSISDVVFDRFLNSLGFTGGD